ncbi:MAG: hypothetical protein ABI162_12990 [Luteolibacter sp.]
MLDKHKPGITLLCTLTAIAVLFPPVNWGYSSRVLKTGFAFLFESGVRDGMQRTINLPQLALEIILMAIVSFIFEINRTKIAEWVTPLLSSSHRIWSWPGERKK